VYTDNVNTETSQDLEDHILDLGPLTRLMAPLKHNKKPTDPKIYTTIHKKLISISQESELFGYFLHHIIGVSSLYKVLGSNLQEYEV
jgi:hypothetical protein